MENIKWWGEFNIDDQTLMSWQLGERCIVIKRQENEWNCWNVETATESQNKMLLTNTACSSITDENEVGRFLSNNSSKSIHVFPKLADRSVIARPSAPLTILAGEKIKLFVSTPVWFYAETSVGKQCLLDTPFWRPSDSWFGASTIDGHLCYAKYTSAKVQLKNIDVRVHRAITTVEVINRNKTALTINRINLPVNYLNLYADPNNNLWTSEISMAWEAGAEEVELIIDKNIATQGADLVHVTPPRITTSHNRLIQRISHLWG